MSVNVSQPRSRATTKKITTYASVRHQNAIHSLGVLLQCLFGLSVCLDQCKNVGCDDWSVGGGFDEGVLLRESYYIASGKHSWVALELHGGQDVKEPPGCQRLVDSRS